MTFNQAICHARVNFSCKAVSRRMAGFSSEIWQLDNLQLNPINHQVLLNDQLLLLSGKEYQLLYELVKNADNVVRKADLEQRLFGFDDKIESNSLEVHIHNLRRKIGKDRIITIRGIGYLLKKKLSQVKVKSFLFTPFSYR